MGQKETLVSVIIPYYRSNDTIDRALESIFKQSIKNYEIIIIDDFSNRKIDTEKLLEINNYNKVKVIFLNENIGPGGARNIGISKATGEYIAFLDSDDAWKSNKLELQLEIMKKYNAFISGHHSAIKGEREHHNIEIKSISKYKQLITNYFPTRSVMIKNEGQYKFLDSMRYAEDYLLWTQIILEGKRAIYINKTLSNSFKEDFGEAGLTASLKNMHEGVIDTFQILYHEKKLTFAEFIILKSMERVKYARRIIIKNSRDNKK
ncbi:glycosyltransferase family 2 protein [Macrococcoides goetzii]|nr:glycosyltransferase family 2 protein [Macrococcus goetzii]TDM39894.1 glycosyltransferase family 2 protein [Macrococcus goetzii]